MKFLGALKDYSYGEKARWKVKRGEIPVGDGCTMKCTNADGSSPLDMRNTPADIEEFFQQYNAKFFLDFDYRYFIVQLQDKDAINFFRKFGVLLVINEVMYKHEDYGEQSNLFLNQLSISE